MAEIHSATLRRLLLQIATAEVVYNESSIPVLMADGTTILRPLVRCTIAGAFHGHGKDRYQAWAGAAYEALLAMNGPWKAAQHIEGYVADRTAANAEYRPGMGD